MLPYYNAANPSVAWSGPNNSGTAQNTVRRGACVVSAKAGTAAASPAAPAADAGYTGLYTVTVANGQSAVTAANISQLAAAPFLSVKLPGLQVLGSRPLSNTTGGISLVQTYPGGPAGAVAGNAASGTAPPDLCWDTANSALYVCTGTGTAATAVWTPAARPRLTANRTYYVRTNGSDANAGLANTAGGAFLTIQKAVDTAYGLDFNGFTVTVQVADGTYAGTVKAARPFTGAGAAGFQILGNPAAPGNCTLTAANDAPLDFRNGACGAVGGFTLVSTGAGGAGVYAGGPGTLVTVAAPVVFGGIAGGTGTALNATTFATIYVNANVTFTAGCGIGVAALSGLVQVSNVTVTLAGTPAFSYYFASANNCGVVVFRSVTFAGAATGVRYSAVTNAVIDTAAAGAAYLPGGTAGTTATGGQYV